MDIPAEGVSAQVLGDEEIFDRALMLLRQEPEYSRPKLLSWAVGELERSHHIDLPGRIDLEDDFQVLGDMLLDNPMLGDWLRAASINRATILASESFRELIDRLAPILRTT